MLELAELGGGYGGGFGGGGMNMEDIFSNLEIFSADISVAAVLVVAGRNHQIKGSNRVRIRLNLDEMVNGTTKTIKVKEWK